MEQEKDRRGGKGGEDNFEWKPREAGGKEKKRKTFQRALGGNLLMVKGRNAERKGTKIA